MPTSKVTAERMQNTIDRLQCLHQVLAGENQPVTQVRIERRNIKVELSTDGQDFKKSIKFSGVLVFETLTPKLAKRDGCITKEENKKIQDSLKDKKK